MYTILDFRLAISDFGKPFWASAPTTLSIASPRQLDTKTKCSKGSLLPSALCPLPSALCPLPSALCPLPSALCPLPSKPFRTHEKPGLRRVLTYQGVHL